MTQKEALEAYQDIRDQLFEMAKEADASIHYLEVMGKKFEVVRQYIEGQGSVLYELLDKCFYINSTDGGIDWRYNELFVLYEDEPELSSKLLEFLNGHIPEGREGEE